MILSDTAIRNRVTVFVLIVLITVAGVFSYVTLPREAAPDVKTPWIVITTTYEGVSPEDIENTVTKEIEKELAGLSGLKEITSASDEGISTINCEFLPNVNIDEALRRVKDKVDIARSRLPADAKEPTVSEINIAELPIMMINIAGPISPVRLKAIADQLEDEIKSVDGVLDVVVLGALEREIRIEVDQDRAAAYGLEIDDVIRRIRAENVNVSAGGLETAGMKFNVRVPAEFIDPSRIAYIPLTEVKGRQIYLSDVAEINDTFKDRTSYSRLDGQESITVAVKKRVGANIVRIAETVKAILDAARGQAPKGVRFVLTTDRSDDIHMMVSDLEDNMVAALVLVVAVLFAFMGLRSSFIVALAIPLSMLMSFAIIQMLGYTLNMVVLFSLILALGMLVDNAIVIVENIYRHRQLGMGKVEAARKGTSEVAWPVITSTATTVAAFIPLLFWPGIMGDFMKHLPITLIITLSSSLFVALVISPVLTTVVIGHVEPRKKRDNGFLRGYRRVLTLALDHRYATLALSFLVLAGISMLYVKRSFRLEFFPEIDPKEALVNIRNPQGTNIVETDRIAGIIEKRIEKFRLGPSGETQIRYNVANTGTAGGFRLVGRADGPHVANLTVTFPDFDDRKRPSPEVLAEIRSTVADIAGGEIKVEKLKHGPPTGSAVTVRIMGEDFQELERLSDQAKRLIQDVPNLINVRSDLESAKPELVFRVSRERAKMLGVDTTRIGLFLKAAVFGIKAASFRQFNDEYDITVRLPLEQRTRIDDLLLRRIPTARGKAVPLSSLGYFEYVSGYGTIYRVNEKRVVTVTGDAEGREGPAVLQDVQKTLTGLPLPARYSLRYAGEKEQQDEAQAFLTQALGIALLLIALILVAQFNTLSVPFIIMTTVLLSTIGVFVGLLACDQPFGVIMTGIGVISLAGVVVNNAIVLLDYTRKLQKRGMTVLQAAVQAGMTRLRPVLLTAGTTVLGLVPMATGYGFNFHTFRFYASSESSQWWSSMATAVIFGLTFATILTLVVVPSLYVIFYGLASRFGLGGLHKVGEDEEAAQEAAAVMAAPSPVAVAAEGRRGDGNGPA